MANGIDAARKSEVDAILSGGRREIDSFLITGIMSLNENGCARGQQDRAEIEAIKQHLSRHGRQSDDNDKKFLGFLNLGLLKSGGVPAVIISLFIGWAIYDKYDDRQVAATLKEETSTNAVVVAEAAARREHRSLDREDIREVLHEEIAAYQDKIKNK